MNRTLTHISRPRCNQPMVKASTARCIRENIVLPIGIIGFFGYVLLTAVGVV